MLNFIHLLTLGRIYDISRQSSKYNILSFSPLMNILIVRNKLNFWIDTMLREEDDTEKEESYIRTGWPDELV
jgi:hypothetical protein